MNVDFTGLINFFEANPYLNIVSLLIAILGIILSIYFYQRSLKLKKPIFLVRTINLVKQNVNKIESVEILYKGDKIQNLSISKIALWNDGKDTINFNDIAQNNPIKISIDESYQILDAEIIFQKNPSNDFRIELQPNQKSAILTFDYFDFAEGTIINVYHTGESSQNISLTGTVKSVRNIARKTSHITFVPSLFQDFFESKLSKRKLSRKKTIGWLTIALGILMVLTCLQYVFTTEEITKRIVSTSEKWGLGIMALVYLYLGIQILKRRTPRGFDIFHDEF